MMKNTNLSPKSEEAYLVMVIRLAENSSKNTNVVREPFSGHADVIEITFRTSSKLGRGNKTNGDLETPSMVIAKSLLVKNESRLSIVGRYQG